MKKREIIIGVMGLVVIVSGTIGGGLALWNASQSSRQSVVYDDIPYCSSTNERQEMDILVPASATDQKPAPVVIYVHGGGWTEGSLRDNIDDYYPPFLIEKGIAFVTVDYRLAPEFTYPAQNDDVQCAYQFLKQNAATYRLDMERVGLFGDSAGGQLAAMQALSSEARDSIDGVVMFYGVSDLWYQLTEKNDQFALNYLGKRDEALAKSASPRYADLTDAPPFLLIHGTKDALVPHQESLLFRDALTQHRISVTLITLEGAQHGFGDDAGSRYQAEAQQHLTDFFERQLLP